MPARFHSPMDLRLMEDANGLPVLTSDGRSMWTFVAPLVFEDSEGHYIKVPVGAHTDLASIPRLAWDELPPDGPWAKAAGVHDFLYVTKGTGDFGQSCYVTKPGGYTREEADKVLDDAMAALGVPADKRVIIYEAVRVGGEGGWGF